MKGAARELNGACRFLANRVNMAVFGWFAEKGELDKAHVSTTDICKREEIIKPKGKKARGERIEWDPLVLCQTTNKSTREEWTYH